MHEMEFLPLVQIYQYFLSLAQSYTVSDGSIKFSEILIRMSDSFGSSMENFYPPCRTPSHADATNSQQFTQYCTEIGSQEIVLN